MRKILTYAFSMSLMPLAFTALLLTGCADYDAVYEEMMRREQEGTVELCISIGVSNDRLSRSPLEGEEGDGHKFGQHNENKVNSVLLFYYNSPQGINAPDNTVITKLAYVDEVPEGEISSDPTKGDINCDIDCPYTQYYVTTIKLNGNDTNNYLYRSGDHYIVITNTENWDADEIPNLGALRNKLVTQSWTAGANFAKYDNFVMSNEHESYYESGKGTMDDPHHIIVTIERVAARIDFAYDPTETTEATLGAVPVLHYKAKDTPTKTGIEETYGYVNLTHVRPFNVMQTNSAIGYEQGSYLIKRSALPDKSGTRYLDPETAHTNEAVADFPIIVEPTTWSKSTLGLDPEPTELTKWYGSTRSSVVDATYASNSAYAIHHSSMTLEEDGFNGGVSTDGGDRYYVLDYANENTMEADKSLKDYATGYILRAVYEPKTIKAGVWTTEEPKVMTSITDVTSSYSVGSTFYRYRPLVTTFDESQAVYFTLEADANEYGNHQLEATGIPYVIEKYTNGVCYYHVYARHDNSGGSPDATPMEFGIVRNNIYRLKVSFSGPGYPEPEVTNTEPLGIKPYLYTRPWYKVEHEEIEI